MKTVDIVKEQLKEKVIVPIVQWLEGTEKFLTVRIKGLEPLLHGWRGFV